MSGKLLDVLVAKMEKISWKEKVTNEVLRRINEERSVIRAIRKQPANRIVTFGEVIVYRSY